jgi:hypothetical protein
MSEPQSTQEPHPYITANIARKAFRGFLPMFAHFWQEAQEAAPEDSLNAVLWPDYILLLRACQDILSLAPMHPGEAKKVNIEKRYVRSLERLATALAHIFPGGFRELENYVLTEQEREWRRSRGLARYQRMKSRRRRVRRRP